MFKIDTQTINDLDLYEKFKGEKSILSFFNFTKSIGGKKKLEYLFSNPLIDLEIIEKRIEITKFFRNNIVDFEIYKEALDFIEYYLIQQNVPNRFSILNSFLNEISYLIKPKNEYYIIKRGIRFLITTINNIYDFAISINSDSASEFLINCKQKIIDKIENTALQTALNFKTKRKLLPFEYGKFDYYFRKTKKHNIRELLEIIYEIDVYKSIAFAATKYQFSLPFFTKEENNFQVNGLFHPFVENPVINDFQYYSDKNLCFLTGPNMAGKSTFLKSISLCIYLSHIGFPVPAKFFKTSIFNGIYTTINLSDSINKGYSHFYSEVLRVKYIAEQLNNTGNIFVVFDELFRGTNVKDAFEASLSVISSFSKIKKGLFAISTHIIEIAESLKNNKSIFYKYFEAHLSNETPEYNYKIYDGVTEKRIGMYILKKEKVIETIENAAI
jgi:DNA mismatch repair ATPase MutS